MRITIFVVMSGRFKHISAIVMLFLFLYPQVQKGMHDFGHQNDFHCSSTAAHFHQAEHDCSLCDFNILPGTNVDQSTPSIQPGTSRFLYFPPVVSFLFSSFLQLTGSRAPPFLI